MLKQKKKWAIEYLDLENEKTATLASDYDKNKNDFGEMLLTE
jgi:hypothetical protein